MATVQSNPSAIHAPPPPNARRPKGILKNSYQKSPPVSPTQEKELSEKEITILNTQTNAGHRRSSSSTSRPSGTCRRMSRTPSQCADDENAGSQRLQWDEANLYLTEQERTATMKITEPKTPYARHYEPSKDDDEEMADDESKEDIPGLSLGEPEEAVPEGEFSSGRKQSKVHVNDHDATPLHDADNDYLGMTPEEREKHRKFEELRKKHYEMKNVAKFLGHPEELEDLDDDTEQLPDVPTINGAEVRADD
ncbi:hypothetical protein F5Y17DRAFT_58819 [Xylariaceae sp. FL0594]|nr:hypothetical protein F5Y17DRAFT_58819 [Xylariaceae sp. FL0594]